MIDAEHVERTQTSHGNFFCVEDRYELAIPRKDMEEIDIDWQSPEEDLRDLIEDELGEEPAGTLKTFDLNQPAPVFQMGSRDPTDLGGVYTITAEFHYYPNNAPSGERPPLRGVGDEEEHVVSSPYHSLLNPSIAFQDDKEYTGSFSLETDATDELVDAMQSVIDTVSPDSSEETVADGGDSWVGDIEMKECPNCDEEFEAGSGIDGDDGTEFCSLPCINEYANE
jgi:hypothetical protein